MFSVFGAVKSSFRPLTGMVPFKKYDSAEVTKFSPPYGDGTMTVNEMSIGTMFSPPYGDGTGFVRVVFAASKFSPPYGDSTLNISQNIVKWKS